MTESDGCVADHQCLDVFEAVRKKHLACLCKYSTTALLIKDQFGQTILHYAVKTSDFTIIKYLVERFPSLKGQPSCNGETPVLIAAAQGDMNVVEVMLAGPLRDAIRIALHRDINGTSVLMACVAKGDNHIALWLLKKFGKTLAMLPNNSRMLPLHVAAAQGNVEYIRIATKYDNQMANYRDEFGCTPCVYAVQYGCLASVRYLVEKAHGEMGTVSNKGQSLLHIACLCRHEHIARWILHRTGSTAILWKTNDQANAFHCASFSGSTSITQLLLSFWSRKKRRDLLALRDIRGNTPLHLAAINNHLEAAQTLLMNGADVKLENVAGHTAGMVALLRGHKQMETLISQFQGKKLRESSRKLPHDSGSIETFEFPYCPYMSNSNSERERLSPRDLSSISSGDKYSGSTWEVIRHQMRFIDDYSDFLKDSEAQTDKDLLQDHIKVLNDQTWESLGLSAVEHIDKVLEDLDVYD